MRKQLLALSLILVMLLGITAQASGPAMLPAAQTSLSFSVVHGQLVGLAFGDGGGFGCLDFPGSLDCPSF